MKPGLATVRSRSVAKSLLVVGAVLVGLLMAVMITNGLSGMALVALFAYPAFLLIHRQPLVVVPIWLFMGPLITVTDNPGVRAIFWFVHRGLPLAALIAILVSQVVSSEKGRLPKLGLPELMMGGYALVTALSILYRSLEPLPVSYLFYDRILAPMMLYLVIRLVEPSPREIRRLIPAFAFVLLFEMAVGLLSWVAPSVLPGFWLNNQGARTVGSLSEVNLFGSTVLIAGLFLFYDALASRKSGKKILGSLLLGLAIFMAFLTFSRASWLAAVVVLLGLLTARPRQVATFVAASLAAVVLVVSAGLLDQQLEFANQRFASEESSNSALSRLPVVVASVRMLEERPLIGWGYENFDRFDYQFYGAFGNLTFPGRDHASHNLFLTILAEQGAIGFALYIGPALYWLVLTVRHYRRLPVEGYIGRNLVLICWLGIAAHIVVNNFTRMQLPFGFGLYWILLGLIASTIYRFRPGHFDGTDMFGVRAAQS